MDPQGSTPGQNLGANASPAAPADTQQPSLPAQNGDLLGRLQDAQDNNTPTAAPPADSSAGTPSQNPDQPPQQDDQNQSPAPAGDSGVDESLQKWAQSQNLSLTTPTEIALAKRLRDTQSWAHNQSRQKFDQIQSDSGDDYTVMNNKIARMEFFDSHPDARTLETDMIDYVVKLKESGDDNAAEFYAGHWDQLYTLVKAQKASDPFARNDVEEEARRLERENLARAQQSAPPVRAASSSTPGPTQVTDEQIAKMSMAEYEEWRKANNPFAG